MLAGLALGWRSPAARDRGGPGCRRPEGAGFGAVLLLGPGAKRPPVAASLGLRVCLLGLAAGCAGIWLGAGRVEAIDAGALSGPTARPVTAAGYVVSVPRRSDGEVRFEVETSAGRVAVQAGRPVPDLPVGTAVRATGLLGDPDPWMAGMLRRHGIAQVLEAERLSLVGGERGGLAGRMDLIRNRAERALGRGMAEPESALARGFVLGEDDRIDQRTRIEFKRSGLAHLLAVSGQNVVLLCVLAWPLMALLGLTLRARLVALLALIAVYVAVTGAGPSIQRAGVMGAAGVIAGLAGTPRSRWYALLLAAVVTLAVNPRACGDVGWQLSFAATAGIMLWSARLASLLAGREPRASRRALADGVAVTAAATVATAPLMAYQFEALSIAALPANMLALPAVAPAMWLGMLAGIAGQLPAIPVEPLNWLTRSCSATSGRSPTGSARPAGPRSTSPSSSPVALIGVYAGLVGAVELALAAGARRRGLTASRRPRRARAARRRVLAAIAGVAVAVVGALWLPGERGGDAAVPERMVVRILDVGQGDSILLDPPAAAPVLIDAGPPEADVGERLREQGVRSLAALIVTHDQSDHAGGAYEVLDSVAVDRLGFGRLGPRAAGRRPRRGGRAHSARRGLRAARRGAPARGAVAAGRAASGAGERSESGRARDSRRMAPSLGAADRRRRGGGGPDRPRRRRRAQGRPPRKRGRRPRCPARSRRPQAGGDLGGGGEPLRSSHRQDPCRAPGPRGADGSNRRGGDGDDRGRRARLVAGVRLRPRGHRGGPRRQLAVSILDARQHCGKGSYIRAGETPRVVVVRKNGRPLVIFPTVISRIAGVTTAQFLGDPLIQYGDVIAAPDASIEQIEDAWSAVADPDVVSAVLLRKVRADAKIAPVMEKAAGRLSETEAPFLDLRQLHKPRSKHVRELQRLRRRLAEAGEVKLEFVRGPAVGRTLGEVLDLKKAWLAERGLPVRCSATRIGNKS